MLGVAAWAADTGAPVHFLVTNDDTAASFPPSTVSFYAVGADGSLASPKPVSTGGNGIAGGYFGIARVLVVASGQDACVYASNAQSENIAAIDTRTRKLTGLFRGSLVDGKLARNGIGLAASGNRLYATLSGSGNIGAFRIQPGCQLQFVGDVHAQGLGGGTAEGIAIHGSMMVVTYGDGSIESFDISGGLPVSHDDGTPQEPETTSLRVRWISRGMATTQFSEVVRRRPPCRFPISHPANSRLQLCTAWGLPGTPTTSG
jgi:hypothetical protein